MVWGKEGGIVPFFRKSQNPDRNLQFVSKITLDEMMITISHVITIIKGSMLFYRPKTGIEQEKKKEKYHLKFSVMQ